MGLTEKGYQRRTYDDIVKDMSERAKELFGEDIDTSDQGTIGKFIRIIAYDHAIAEEEREKVYYARFPNTASGQSLDRLLPFVGITRNPATAAIYRVKVQGKANHVIEAGFVVSTDTDITYQTAQAYTIGEDGTVLVDVSCTEAGSIGNLSSATAICKPMNPDANIAAVVGTECLETGKDEESDAALRVRFAAAVAGSGSCNENAIRAAILRIPTVQYAAVIANNDDEADSAGRPPHSFECYVLGGDDYEQEIAEAIFSKRPIGIKTVGDKAVSIIDVSGTERIINYSPAEKVMVTVKAQIKTSSSFAEDGVSQVQANVSTYINDIGIGTSLVLSTIYGHIYSVTGVREVTSLELSTDGGSTYTTGNIAISSYGVAVCADVHVEVVA